MALRVTLASRKPPRQALWLGQQTPAWLGTHAWRVLQTLSLTPPTLCLLHLPLDRLQTPG